MRLRGPGALDGGEAPLSPKLKGSGHFGVSPRFMLVIFFIFGVITWALFSYDQRAMAELLRGRPKGRKYLEAEKFLDSQGDINLYVIPGGGSGMRSTKDEEGFVYPEWTRRRTLAAVKHAKENFGSAILTSTRDADKDMDKDKDNLNFLALSAGSLNSPNARNKDHQVVFECTHTIRHLVELGVSQDRIHGDFMSWDTITNGYVLRMTAQALLARYPGAERINIEVFISDFHLERMQASLEWLLGLSGGPSEQPLLGKVMLRMHSVSSEGIEGLSYFGKPDKWGKPAPVSDAARALFRDRQEHEKRGVEQIARNRKIIRSEGQFQEWLLLGGHQGLSAFLRGDGSYVPSRGEGW